MDRLPFISENISEKERYIEKGKRQSKLEEATKKKEREKEEEKDGAGEKETKEIVIDVFRI